MGRGVKVEDPDDPEGRVLARPAPGEAERIKRLAGVSVDPRDRAEPNPNGQPQPATAAKVAAVVTLSDVTPERVRWRWKPYLAAGKLTVVDGDPGDGKSTLAVDLAARYSTGSPMPDGADSDGPGDVLVLSAEDGIADTIRPRVDAASGDPTRVHVLKEVVEAGKDRPPDLTCDLDVIRAEIERHDVRLVIVDPLMAFLGADVDSHRDQDVRRVLHPLSKLAEATGVALLVIRHLNKGGGAKAVYRGGGSIGIIGAARLAYLVAPDPDDDTRRVLAPVKLNIAADPAALAYRIVTDAARDVSRVVWEGATGHSAGDLLRTIDPDERSELGEAAEWLRDYLVSEGGEAAAADAKSEARKAGLAVRTVERARGKVADVKTSGFPRRSTWVLHASDATAPTPAEVGATEGVGATGKTLGFQDPAEGQSRQSRQPPESGVTGDASTTPEPGKDVPL